MKTKAADFLFNLHAAINTYTQTAGHTFDPQSALIDMDGVLYDSMPRRADAWLQMCEEIGMHCTRDEFFRYEGMTGRATIQLLMRKYCNRTATEEECEKLYRRKSELFASEKQRPLMPDAYRMLNVLGTFGMKRVLVTGSGQTSLLNALAHDYPGIFNADRMVTAADVLQGKPHPEPYIKGLAKAHCSQWQAIVVENAPLGVESGRRAGCFVCAVATGPIPAAELKAAGAHLVFDSMCHFADSLPVFLHSAKKRSLL